VVGWGGVVVPGRVKSHVVSRTIITLLPTAVPTFNLLLLGGVTRQGLQVVCCQGFRGTFGGVLKNTICKYWRSKDLKLLKRITRIVVFSIGEDGLKFQKKRCVSIAVTCLLQATYDILKNDLRRFETHSPYYFYYTTTTP
jgi:hypothetical protein